MKWLPPKKISNNLHSEQNTLSFSNFDRIPNTAFVCFKLSLQLQYVYSSVFFLILLNLFKDAKLLGVKFQINYSSVWKATELLKCG